jgi:hypothetical protein
MTSPPRTVPAKCQECGTEFLTWKNSVDKGYGRFCGRSCAHQSRRVRVELACLLCGNVFSVWESRVKRGDTKYCSLSCKRIGVRAKRLVDKKGYVTIWSDDGRKVAEHRHIAEGVIGRKLIRSEHVHHKNENPSDNDPSNLVVLSRSEHISLHHKIMKWSKCHDACLSCGTTDIPHRGHGLCRSCGGSKYYREVTRSR